jgi:phosphoglycolate phosphatase-like HAD superfamily hydrolase
MTIDLIVSDWNGTLVEPLDDEAFNRKLAFGAVFDAARAVLRGRVWRLSRIAKGVRTKIVLDRAVRRYRGGKIDLAELYDAYNRHVVRGISVELVERVAAQHAAGIARLVDTRVTDGIASVHDAGCKTAILTAAYGFGVRCVLQEAGLAGLFDDVVANDLEAVDGSAIGFTARHREGKTDDFEAEFLERRGHDAARVVYFGDSAFDEQIAPLLPGGHFVVPFYATDDFKRHMASTHGAFVPTTADGLRDHLASL